MKLSYRGIKYNQEPSVVNFNLGNGVPGKYRGVDWQAHSFNQLPVKLSHSPLVYRGISYS